MSTAQMCRVPSTDRYRPTAPEDTVSRPSVRRREKRTYRRKTRTNAMSQPTAKMVAKSAVAGGEDRHQKGG